jgi:hypothetical protein
MVGTKGPLPPGDMPSITIIRICGVIGDEPHVNRMRPEPEGYPDFLFAGVTAGGHTLPITVPPKDSFSVVYPIKPNDFPEVRELYVTTTDGKTWLCPRKNIRAIHKDKVYKALREKRYIPYNERKKLKASKN